MRYSGMLLYVYAICPFMIIFKGGSKSQNYGLEPNFLIIITLININNEL